MAGYTPVFDSVFHGTLCGRWPTLAVWLTILPMADKHGHIDMTPQAMAALTGWPLDLLKQAIHELMQPDPESRSDAHEGRRLVLIDPNRSWGWRVVNHDRYREKARKSAYDAERTASGADRERKAASRAVPTSPAPSRAVPLSDSDANTNSNPSGNKTSTAAAPPTPVEFDELKRIFPKRAGDQPWPPTLQACNARLREGHTWNEILDGARRYARFCEATGKVRTETVMQAKRFCGPSKPFLNSWDLPATKAEARQDKNISASEQWLREQEANDASH